jgi:putative ABC transport system ATP-binding protein
MLHGRPLMLLDEPTGQLDRATAVHVSGVLRRVVAPGKVAVVAHVDPTVIDVCDHVIDLGGRSGVL